jgi:hypothetical protein
MLRMRSIAVGLAMLGIGPMSAPAINVCNYSDVIDMSNTAIPPFGGEYIGVIASVGEIVNTNVDIEFTATGTFNAADIGVAFEVFDASGGAGVSFSGAQLGWIGQGTFKHTFNSNLLNGLLYPGPGQPFSGMLIVYTNLNPGNGPITGNFDRLVFRIDYGQCPIGDVNHDLNVNVDDLIAVILAWGDCPPMPEPCDADTNASGSVDVDDLVNVILNWQTFCPKCS